MKAHRAWHWWWALIWSALHWYTRSAQHLDAWFILMADDLELHVMHPNEERVGCRLRTVA